MAGKSFDPKLTVVVSNTPADVGEDELTIHFRQERNGGGDVDDVVLDESGSVAFVIFDLAEVASSVVNQERIIHGTKVQVESYQLWLTNKKKQEGSVDIKEESYLANEIFTVYVSGFEDSTTDDAIMCFFENKRRSGGGELREDDYKRISPTIACLTFVDSKDAENVLKKANETPLQFVDGNVLKVNVVLEPTHDRSILLASNLNPKTSEETLRNFTETKMHSDVLNVVLGRNGRAIVILRNEFEIDSLNEKNSSEDMSLDGFIISLEFAPVTKGITLRNIPQGTSHDDIKFKFSNPMKGGGKVTDLTLDKKNRSANIYFVECSVVSRLVKMEHRFKGDLLTVFPYYDDFEVTEEAKTKTAEYSSNYSLEPVVWDFIMNHYGIEKMFNFKTMNYDKTTSTFLFSKQFDDPKDAAAFERKMKEFFNSFHKAEVKIPTGVFNKVKEVIESKRDQFKAGEIDVKFDRNRVILIGKKEQVNREKASFEKTMRFLYPNDFTVKKRRKSEVPEYWDVANFEQSFLKVRLPTSCVEYQNVEAEFRKTAPNNIVSIERIQNEEIYELYDVKRNAMMKKYGRGFPGKELMLFHGTSRENIDAINARGLNRSYAGMHATIYGRGVYFARDAIYSCRTSFSPPDSQGFRYMYYARVLVGEYTTGSSNMRVAPPKQLNPSENYDSVVNSVRNPSVYVLFQDYEYYTEYLITFQ